MQAAGVVLEADMSLNKSGNLDDDVGPNAALTATPYGVSPHTANEAHAKWMAGVPTASQSSFT